jgi:hypothetical protein
MDGARNQLRTEAHMTTPMAKVLPHSDSIAFKSISTGGQSAGNGGDGSFKGSISNQPTIKFDPSNSITSVKRPIGTPAPATRAPRSTRRLTEEMPSRTEIRAPAAAMIPPRYPPIRRPIRKTTSPRTSTSTWWPALAATAETATSRGAGTSISASDRWFVRLTATGGTRRRSSIAASRSVATAD